MRGIVRSVLQFSRGKTSQRSDQDLRDVVERYVQLTKGYATERKASLYCVVADEPCMVSMSELEMEQVLVNGIQNALESGEQEIHVRVEVEQLRSDELVCVTVRDDGRGIEAENRGHIFDPFYTPRLRQGGSGLGLSVAHGIVASHGGHIEVDGDEGVGTTIRIVLPRADPERPTA